MQRRTFIGGSAVILAAHFFSSDAVGEKPTKLPVIGFLKPTSPGPLAPFVAAFHRGLSETGYVEGQNATIEYRCAEGHFDRLPALAADLVRRKVDVIASTGDVAPVAGLARPGGNLTGFTLLGGELTPKRLELLSELAPQAGVIVLLVHPDSPATGSVQDVASAKAVQQLHVLKAGTESEIDTAFASLASLHAGALLVGGAPFFDTERQKIVALASRYAVPAIYSEREFAVAGGLISYGTSRTAAYRQVGMYVGRILEGAKPADLPVQQPTTFEVVINLKTAAALGLTVPPSILARADEVIE